MKCNPSEKSTGCIAILSEECFEYFGILIWKKMCEKFEYKLFYSSHMGSTTLNNTKESN